MTKKTLRAALAALALAIPVGAAVEIGAARIGAGAAQAQSEAAALADADRLLGLIFESGLIQQTLEALNPILIAQVEQAAGAEGVRLDEAARTRLIEIATQETVWMYEDMRPELAQLYAQTFTEKELTILLDLYGSAEGREIMRKLPLLTAGMSPMLTARMPAMQVRVQERIKSEVFPMLK